METQGPKDSFRKISISEVTWSTMTGGIVQNQQRRFAAQFQNDGLEVLGTGLRDQPAHPRRTGKVDSLHRNVCDQGLNDSRRVGRRMRQDVHDSAP
jgi:hypothetical protein